MSGWIAFGILLVVVCIVFVFSKGKSEVTKYSLKSQVSHLQNQRNEFEQKVENLSQSMEELHEVAYTDAETQIGNKDYFVEVAGKSLESEGQYILLGFGISNIVTINRLYGSNEGDKVLTYIANLLKEKVGTRGVYAHVQSNMFAVLIPDTSEEEDFTHPFIDDMTESAKGFSEIFEVELKFGIYRITDKSQPITDMLNCVVLAQRSNPANKEDNFAEFTEELGRKFEDNRRMCAEMEEALNERKFVMYLQPMIDLHTYKIYSAEALVRWEHPERGLCT